MRSTPALLLALLLGACATNEGPRDPERLPAQLIAPTKGEVHWLVDRVAAAGLTDRTLSR